MVTLLDTEGLSKLVNAVGLEVFLRELAEAIALDMQRWGEFEKCVRLASYFRHGAIELMPATDGVLYAFKFVNGHPRNTSLGLPTVTAFGALADVETGYPILISEMTILTALRTAATSALAAMHLARPQATTLALVGTGAQAEFQVLGFKATLGITSVRYFDSDPAAMRKFERNLKGYGLQLTACDGVRACVDGADIITTATAAKLRQTVLRREMVSAGVHINAIGGDCPGKTELDADLVAAARVFVEYEPQTRVEGEIQGVGSDVVVTELWRVLSGVAPGRTHPDDITLFDSVGFALEDFSALRYVNQKLSAFELGRPIALIPALEDPKDLFAALCVTPLVA